MTWPRLNAFAGFLLAAVLLLAVTAANAQLSERGRGRQRMPPPNGQSVGGRPPKGQQPPKGQGQGHGRPGGELTLQPNPVLASASLACQQAANATSSVASACIPASNSNLTAQACKDLQCSDACISAVQGYWSTLSSTCGEEYVLLFRPQNGSVASYNVTAGTLAPAALLKHALGCTKDASGAYCPPAEADRSRKDKRDLDHKLVERHDRPPKGGAGSRRPSGTKRPDGTRRPQGTKRPDGQRPHGTERPEGTRRPHASGTKRAHTESHSHKTRGSRPSVRLGDLEKRHGKPHGLKSVTRSAIHGRPTGLPTKKSAHTHTESHSHSRKGHATRPPRSGSARATDRAHPMVKRGPREMIPMQMQFNATVCAEVGFLLLPRTLNVC